MDGSTKCAPLPAGGMAAGACLERTQRLEQPHKGTIQWALLPPCLHAQVFFSRLLQHWQSELERMPLEERQVAELQVPPAIMRALPGINVQRCGGDGIFEYLRAARLASPVARTWHSMQHAG